MAKALLANGSTMIKGSPARSANRLPDPWGAHGIDTANPGYQSCESETLYVSADATDANGDHWNYIYNIALQPADLDAYTHWLQQTFQGQIPPPCKGEKFNFVIRQNLLAKLTDAELLEFIHTH